MAQVDKLQISGSETDIGVVIGEGTNGYQILDNPLLYGATDTEVRTLGVPIYNRLIAYAAVFAHRGCRCVRLVDTGRGYIEEIALQRRALCAPKYSPKHPHGRATLGPLRAQGAKRPVHDGTTGVSMRRSGSHPRSHETVHGLCGILRMWTGNIAKTLALRRAD